MNPHILIPAYSVGNLATPVCRWIKRCKNISREYKTQWHCIDRIQQNAKHVKLFALLWLITDIGNTRYGLRLKRLTCSLVVVARRRYGIQFRGWKTDTVKRSATSELKQKRTRVPTALVSWEFLRCLSVFDEVYYIIYDYYYIVFVRDAKYSAASSLVTTR
jgi:hypothetical protein